MGVRVESTLFEILAEPPRAGTMYALLPWLAYADRRIGQTQPLSIYSTPYSYLIVYHQGLYIYANLGPYVRNASLPYSPAMQVILITS